MKTIFAILLMCFTSSALAQESPPVEGEGIGPTTTVSGYSTGAAVNEEDNCAGKTGFGAYNCGVGAGTSDGDFGSSSLDGGWGLTKSTGIGTGKVGEDPGAISEQ